MMPKIKNNYYFTLLLVLLSMQIMIALRFYATGTFQRDWRFIWCQFVADVKENPGGFLVTVKYRQLYSLRE